MNDGKLLNHFKYRADSMTVFQKIPLTPEWRLNERLGMIQVNRYKITAVGQRDEVCFAMVVG